MNELLLYGTVGESFWGEECFTARGVRDSIAKMQGPLTVRINSGGGIAPEGQAIYTALSEYDGEVTVVIDGMAASAASLIAMAGDKIEMRLGSFMMIHDPASMWTEGRGTADDHLKVAAVLGVLGNAYADVYARRSGKTRDEARAVMLAETFMDGPAAIAAGFADSYDDKATATAAASFDYRIYRNAPATLQDQSARFGVDAPNKEAILATMTGTARHSTSKPKDKPMAKTPTMTAGAVAAVEVEEAVETTTVVVETETPDTAAIVATATATERSRVTLIQNAVKMAGLSVDMSTDLINRGVTVDAALAEITAKWKGNGDVDTQMLGRQPAAILRDERDTMRAGMSMALESQMSRGKPSDDRARPYMDLSLVDMAAMSLGHKGNLRTAADREDVIRMAMHTTGDFPAILENALNKRLDSSYTLATPTYRSVASEMSFSDFRAHPVSRLSDFPMLQPVAEAGEIKYGTLSEKKESVVIVPFASAMTVSRQMMINDDLGALDRMVANYGLTVAAFEDATFWAMALGGAGSNGPTMTETGRQMFNTTDATLSGTNAAINVASLSAGRAALMKRKRLDGTDMAMNAVLLVVGPDKQTEAEQIVSPIAAQQSGNVNPFSGTLSVVTTPKITGNAWYLFAAPQLVSNFVYGYLDGYAGPRFRVDQPFGRQGTSFSLELDFGCGAVDWRGGWKNIGA